MRLGNDENTKGIEDKKGSNRMIGVLKGLMRRKWIFLTIIVVCGVMVSGIWITDHLVGNARQQMIRDHEAAALTISTFLSAEFTKTEGAVRALAVSPWIAPALVTENKKDLERADSALTGYQRSLGATVCYLINKQGMTIASSNRELPDSFVGKSSRFRPYFQEAIKGYAFSQMALGMTSLQRGLYASAPVCDETGKIIGVVAIKKDLGAIEEFMNQSALCFLIDKYGVIFLTGRRELIFYSLWPLSQTTKEALIATHQYGSGVGLSSPLLPKPLLDRGEVSFKGSRYLASRKPVSLAGWSLVLLTKVDILRTYWIVGSIMTFIICALILVPVGYLFQTVKSKAAIRRSEEKFRLLIENAPDAIYVHADARFIYLNHAAVNLFGAETADQLIGSSIMDRYQSDYRGMITKRLHDLYEERKKLPIVEQVYLRLDGSSVPVEAHAVPITYNDNNAALTFVRDIIDRKQAEKALRESEERYRTLVEKATDIVFRTDDTGSITFVNPAVIRTTGYEEDEIVGKQYTILIRPDMRDEAMKFFGRQFVKGIQNTYSEYPMLTKDGQEVWFGQNTQLIVEDGNVKGFQAVARDITERKEMEALLRESENRYRELSIVDGLTQLYNSRYFYHQLKMEIDRADRYGQPLTLLLLDIDDFKRFNDAYGHVEGDHVLLRLGQVVKRCLRLTDSAYRYGGEEFVALLPMTTGKDGVVTAERIRTEFKNELFSPAPGRDVHVTVSIGLAQFKPQEEMKAFVHRVDQLMYQGKKNGKDRVCSE
jgi:diguanylate cyclase (GGDEF)-like protein/PAS domain S-box-containing protein